MRSSPQLYSAHVHFVPFFASCLCFCSHCQVFCFDSCHVSAPYFHWLSLYRVMINYLSSCVSAKYLFSFCYGLSISVVFGPFFFLILATFAVLILPALISFACRLLELLVCSRITILPDYLQLLLLMLKIASASVNPSRHNGS